jgi:hypothetical protein
MHNHQLEEVSENNDFMEEEEDEVDIDDEFEDIEEDYEENDNLGSNDTGVDLKFVLVPY